MDDWAIAFCFWILDMGYHQLSLLDYQPPPEHLREVEAVAPKEPVNPHLVTWLYGNLSYYRRAMTRLMDLAISDPGPEWQQRMRRHEISRLHEMGIAVLERLKEWKTRILSIRLKKE